MRSKGLLRAIALLGAAVGTSGILFAEPFDQFTVESVKGGSCDLRAKGSSDWAKAQEKSVHPAGSAGRTGAGSTLTLAFDAKNRFRILPKSEVTISISTKDSKFRKVVDLTLANGDVDVELDAMPENHQFKVQTPTAVCGAVGTQFSVSSQGTKNTFSSRRGTIFAASREDGSFSANSIGAGDSLEADVAPGKENSYAELKVNGSFPVAFGSPDRRLQVKDGSVLSLAQEKAGRTDQVALRVRKGGVGSAGAGRYVMKDGKLNDVSGEEKSADLVDEYIDLASKEGSLNDKLRRQKASGASESDIDQTEKDLDQIADEATAKRKELFQHRETIRRTVRDAAEAVRGGPTRVPSMPHRSY